MDIVAYNRHAWDCQVEQGNRWTIPVDPETVAAARRGDWQVVLTPTRPVPARWFPPLAGMEVLCLACGGGQQGPILAAAGARVTVLDNSPAQLARDRLVAERERLDITTIQGDMANLGALADGQFGLIFHPYSNCFAPHVRPVWREAFRVLAPGGVLLAGFGNPALYIFDDALADQGQLVVRHAIPYSDLASLSEEERRRFTDKNEPLVYGHTLEDQIGGQLDAGFLLTNFYEDGNPAHPLTRFLQSAIATRAVKRIGKHDPG